MVGTECDVAMDAQGQHHTPVPLPCAWDGLHALPLLRQCLPGCESLQREVDGTVTLVQRLRVAERSARFLITLHEEDADPPHSYALRFEGSAGDAGFGAGHALVALRADGDRGTTINYQLMFESGGALSHYGQDALQLAVRAWIDAFFRRFDRAAAGAALAALPVWRRRLHRAGPPAVALLAVGAVLLAYLKLHGFW